MFKNYKSKLYNIKGGSEVKVDERSVDLGLELQEDSSVKVKLTSVEEDEKVATVEEDKKVATVEEDKKVALIKACLKRIKEKYALVNLAGQLPSSEQSTPKGPEEGKDDEDDSLSGAEESNEEHKQSAPGAGSKPLPKQSSSQSPVVELSSSESSHNLSFEVSQLPDLTSKKTTNTTIGFVNDTKVKCYLNSFIQLLYLNQDFVHKILTDNTNTSEIFKVLRYLILGLYNDHKLPNIEQAQNKLINHLRFPAKEQQDNSELANRLYADQELSIFFASFKFYIKVSLSCDEKLSKPDNTYAVSFFCVLPSDQSSSIQKLLDNEQAIEPMPKANALRRCEEISYGYKRQNFLPQNNHFLIFIRRKYYNKQKKIYYKYKTDITDLGTIRINKLLFKLKGCIIHSGSAKGGHYKCYSLSDDSIIEYNDDIVTNHKKKDFEMIMNTFEKEGTFLLYETTDPITKIKPVYKMVGDKLQTEDHFTHIKYETPEATTTTAAESDVEESDVEKSEKKYIKYNDKYLKYKTKYLELKEKISNY
jgi:hypothetical protein